MLPTPAEPTDRYCTGKEVIQRTTVEFQHDRGIVYVYRDDGSPVLKITGMPNRIPEIGGTHNLQLTVDVRDGAVCNWALTPTLVTGTPPIPHFIKDDEHSNRR